MVKFEVKIWYIYLSLVKKILSLYQRMMKQNAEYCFHGWLG